MPLSESVHHNVNPAGHNGGPDSVFIQLNEKGQDDNIMLQLLPPKTEGKFIINFHALDIVLNVYSVIVCDHAITALGVASVINAIIRLRRSQLWRSQFERLLLLDADAKASASERNLANYQPGNLLNLKLSKQLYHKILKAYLWNLEKRQQALIQRSEIGWVTPQSWTTARLSDCESLTGSVTTVAPEWHEYWVLISGFPSHAAVDELVDIFFSEINCSDSPWMESTSSSLKSFPSLLAQLIAITMLYLPPEAKIEGLPVIDYLELSERYSNIGVNLVRLLGHRGTTTVTIQHDLLRAAWLKNRGHGAQELGLHRRSGTVQHLTGESFWYNEWKKRLWIVLYIWDSNMSLLLGRPRLINATDCEGDLPLDCDFPGSSQGMSIPAEGHSSRNDINPLFVCLNLFMYGLSHKIHEIRSLGADRPGFQNYAAIQSLHSDISALVEQLPSTIRFPNPNRSWDLQFPMIVRQREKIHTAANCVLMALHRPHIGRHVESREAVLKAGLAILESQQRFFDSITRLHYAFFGNAFFSVDAVIVLSTVVEMFPWGDVNLLQQLVLATQNALGRLCIIESQNDMARAAINIVRSCHQIVKEAYGRGMQMNLAPTPTSMDDSFLSIEDGSTYGFAFPTPSSNDQAGTAIYDIATMDQAVFERSAMLVTEIGAADFDDSYWRGYRQMISNDATDAQYKNSDM
ncbi:hypothetical protein B0O99DRAFT_694418 [Bisporella sp. PMI_857]|nr:hypothetical protein B0O99DRAFT_694418 [Bisporella sp. PMI_857]